METEKKKSSKALTIVISALAPIIVIAVVLGVFGSWALGQIDTYGKVTQDIKTENFAYENQTALKGQTVFVGDSITEYYQLVDSYGDYMKQTGTLVYNRGISAECTDHLLARFDDSVLNIEPKNMVLLIGVNDLGQGVPEDTIYNNIKTMIEKTQTQCPQTNIMLQALYPIDENRPEFYDRFMVGSARTNEQIQSLNARLKTLAEEKGIHYLDLTEQLADENGAFRAEYTMDGLHPNAAGYEIITKAIKPLLK